MIINTNMRMMAIFNEEYMAFYPNNYQLLNEGSMVEYFEHHKPTWIRGV